MLWTPELVLLIVQLGVSITVRDAPPVGYRTKIECDARLGEFVQNTVQLQIPFRITRATCEQRR